MIENEQERKNIQPHNAYISYNKKFLGDDKYQLEIVYCVYRGNILSDIDKKYTKKVEVSADKLEEKEKTVQHSIVKTRKLLTSELKRIGATTKNIKMIIDQKTR